MHEHRKTELEHGGGVGPGALSRPLPEPRIPLREIRELERNLRVSVHASNARARPAPAV